MKKILLSVVALVAAMNVNAQEVFAVTQEAADAVLPGDPTIDDGKGNIVYYEASAAGTVLGATENVTMKLLNEDNLRKTGLSANNVELNGVEFGSKTGFQGKTNPPATATEGTYPTTGFVLSYDVKKDGFLYVLHKSSYNKNYVVYEQEQRIPFAHYMLDEDNVVKGYDLNTVEGATTEKDGIIVIADGYVVGKANEYNDKITKGGTAVIKFPVYAGCKYDVLATGSKITTAGFIFSDADNVKITCTNRDKETGEITTEYILNEGGGSDGIANVKTVELNNGRIYNLAGQEVGKNFKGIVVVNGKKFMNK